MPKLRAPIIDQQTGLPTCPYRGAESAGTFSCAAAAGTSVTGKDCEACAIPEALLHEHACLYLVPLRHEGEGRFACRWFFSFANDPAPTNWRHLCFCHYWFPRPPLDQENGIPKLSEVRARYQRVLRGEEVRRKPLPMPQMQIRRGEPPRGLRGWLREHFPAFR
jgi:hypothetical protein